MNLPMIHSELAAARGEETGITRRIGRVLEGWRGFSAIVRMMHQYPDVDVFVAGGVLRDLVLERSEIPKDFDFFLGGSRAKEAADGLRLRGVVQRGPFGSMRWYPAGSSQQYSDVILIDSFDNGLCHCEDMIDALNQFDFTGNAIALNLRTGDFLDPQNGRLDLLRGILRAVRLDFPSEPIAPGQYLTRPQVLWFRFLHYAAARNLEIEPVTAAWIRRHADFVAYAPDFSKTFFPLHPEALAPLGG